MFMLEAVLTHIFLDGVWLRSCLCFLLILDRDLMMSSADFKYGATNLYVFLCEALIRGSAISDS